jgi:hypothetical protein
VALLVGGTLVAILVVEVGLRIAGIGYPRFYEADPHRGVALRPGAAGWWRKEGEAFIRINSDGLRDREHTRQKPADTYRIAVLGDSYAEAFQLPMEDAFWSVLETELGSCASLKPQQVEVLNFGVSGYGTAQELLTLRHHAWSYDPDLVLLAMLTANDLKNNVRALERDPLRPYFVVNDGRLVLDDSYLQERHYQIRQTARVRILYALLDNSRILQVVNESRNALKNRRAQQRAQENAGDTVPILEVGLTEAIYSAPVSDVWVDAWDVTERLLVQMHEEIRAKGADLFVVTLSNSIQVHPDDGQRREFMERLGVGDLFYPERRLKSFAGETGIAMLNLAPLLLAHAEMTGVPVHGFKQGGAGTGHWNAQGHRRAGELIAEAVCAGVTAE